MSDECVRTDRFYDSETKGNRDEFERDRDRVLYCEAFRRLSGVSQVAYTGESELYHDRLSHSLKVAQVGRRIAEYLDDIGDDCCSIPNADIVETAALAHDIGHPPFGHPAERELDRLIKSKNVSEGFEGNAQSLRTVSHVAVHPETDGKNPPEGVDNNEGSSEQKETDGESSEEQTGDSQTEGDEGESRYESQDSSDFPRGLNLTRASLNAIIKYPWSRSAEDGDKNRWDEDESKKFGRYSSEQELFKWIRKESVNKRRCAEAEIMDWADDLVYAVHDVDDFYRAGVIPLEQILRENSPEREEFIEDYLNQQGDKNDEQKFDSRDDIEDQLDRIRGLAGISREFSGTRLDRAKTKDLSSKLIERYVGEDPNSDFGVTIQEPDSRDDRYLDIDPQLQREVSVLKFMLVKYVLDDPAVSAQRRGERKVISDIFEIFYKATKPDSGETVDIIHQPFREEARRLEKEGSKRERVRLVTDIITSMTEKQAIRIHKRLTGDSPGSLQETIVR